MIHHPYPLVIPPLLTIIHTHLRLNFMNPKAEISLIIFFLFTCLLLPLLILFDFHKKLAESHIIVGGSGNGRKALRKEAFIRLLEGLATGVLKVVAELVFRVLGCKSKRITVTHKKTLVKSMLPVLSSFTYATKGLWTHGWIVKIENYCYFVRFYNGVLGYAPRSELGLDPGSEVSSMYLFCAEKLTMKSTMSEKCQRYTGH